MSTLNKEDKYDKFQNKLTLRIDFLLLDVQ